MSLPAARDVHEIVVGPDQAGDAQRLLGIPVQPGDRVRFEVVEGSVSSEVPRQRGATESSESVGLDPAWKEWLQRLDASEAVTPDVPAAVELARAREQGEV
jgi:hypothetical protein